MRNGRWIWAEVNTVVPLADLEKETVRWCLRNVAKQSGKLRCATALNAD